MDGYLVDLDKVLDEFEEDEDSDSIEGLKYPQQVSDNSNSIKQSSHFIDRRSIEVNGHYNGDDSSFAPSPLRKTKLEILEKLMEERKKLQDSEIKPFYPSPLGSVIQDLDRNQYGYSPTTFIYNQVEDNTSDVNLTHVSSHSNQQFTSNDSSCHLYSQYVPNGNIDNFSDKDVYIDISTYDEKDEVAHRCPVPSSSDISIHEEVVAGNFHTRPNQMARESAIMTDDLLIVEVTDPCYSGLKQSSDVETEEVLQLNENINEYRDTSDSNKTSLPHDHLDGRCITVVFEECPDDIDDNELNAYLENDETDEHVTSDKACYVAESNSVDASLTSNIDAYSKPTSQSHALRDINDTYDEHNDASSNIDLRPNYYSYIDSLSSLTTPSDGMLTGESENALNWDVLRNIPLSHQDLAALSANAHNISRNIAEFSEDFRGYTATIPDLSEVALEHLHAALENDDVERFPDILNNNVEANNNQPMYVVNALPQEPANQSISHEFPQIESAPNSGDFNVDNSSVPVLCSDPDQPIERSRCGDTVPNNAIDLSALDSENTPELNNDDLSKTENLQNQLNEPLHTSGTLVDSNLESGAFCYESGQLPQTSKQDTESSAGRKTDSTPIARMKRPNSLLGLSTVILPHPSTEDASLPIKNSTIPSYVNTLNVITVNDSTSRDFAHDENILEDDPKIPHTLSQVLNAGSTPYNLMPEGSISSRMDCPASPPNMSNILSTVMTPVGVNNEISSQELTSDTATSSNLSTCREATSEDGQYCRPNNTPPTIPPDSTTIPAQTEATSEVDIGLEPRLESMNTFDQLGRTPPRWVPDSEAPNCMQCEARFTFMRRRHHCRACGKVFCARCCSSKNKLLYMGNGDARVCVACKQLLQLSAAASRQRVLTSPQTNTASAPSESVLNDSACGADATLPPVGVLKREGTLRNSEPKQVMFSDGIRPGGDLTELDGRSDTQLPHRPSPGRRVKKVQKISTGEGVTSSVQPALDTHRTTCLVPEHGLPPVVTNYNNRIERKIRYSPDMVEAMNTLSDECSSLVTFLVNKNLCVSVKIVNLDCCINKRCWCFSSEGMCTVGQDEIVIILECLPNETSIPLQTFGHFQHLYDQASLGHTVSDLSYSILQQTFLDSKDHGGFIYIKSTFQCLRKLTLPPGPHLFAILLQKWEIPWAKVFPLRLLLRLGAEFRYYPCPLISTRMRRPVFYEIGHTIMNLLADFRNYQYMLPHIPGTYIHMEDKQTLLTFPSNRYNEILKVVNISNEHVMAFSGCFSLQADSHLVSIQNEDGAYQTQAINIQNKPRMVTGASFIVFNGSLKANAGLMAKSSIIEDGLMIQISVETMVSLKQAIKDMKPFVIWCGSVTTQNPDETVTIRWIDDSPNTNIGERSIIDGMALDGVRSLNIHKGTDYVGDNCLIRWTEVFFIKTEDGDSKWDPVDLSRLAEDLAHATCIALTPFLDSLKDACLDKLAVRAMIDSEQVSYDAGSRGDKLPDVYMNDLDNELIPVIHRAASNNHHTPTVLELIFHILE